MTNEEKQKALDELAWFEEDFQKRFEETKQERHKKIVSIWVDKNGINELSENVPHSDISFSEAIKENKKIKKKMQREKELLASKDFKRWITKIDELQTIENDLKLMWTNLKNQIEKSGLTLDKVLNFQNNKKT